MVQDRHSVYVNGEYEVVCALSSGDITDEPQWPQPSQIIPTISTFWVFLPSCLSNCWSQSSNFVHRYRTYRRKVLALGWQITPILLWSGSHGSRNPFLANVICYRPSVCRLSVVGNTRAPYSADCNFGQYFYGVRYLGHPLTSTENFTEIVPREPLRRGS